MNGDTRTEMGMAGTTLRIETTRPERPAIGAQ
jgi:hypothetical protein